jgi:hypothetical protein
MKEVIGGKGNVFSNKTFDVGRSIINFGKILFVGRNHLLKLIKKLGQRLG